MSPTSLLLKWYLTPQSAMSQPANLQGIHSWSLLDWSKEIRHKMCRSISLGPKQLWWGARTVRVIGHLDVSGKGAHVFFNTFLVCVLVVCGPSKACHPRQEPLLPRYIGFTGYGSMWALVFGYLISKSVSAPFCTWVGMGKDTSIL